MKAKSIIKILTCFIFIKKLRKKVRSFLFSIFVEEERVKIVENALYVEDLKSNFDNTKTCYIIGNSPSNKKLDLTKLNNDFVITVGSGFKLKDFGLNGSNLHIFGDRKGYNELIGSIDPEFSKVYCLLNTLTPESWMKKVFQFSVKNYGSPCEMKFEYNADKPLYHNHSVISYALQIAVSMGFKKIVFLGVDLDFTKQQGHFYESTNNEKQRQIDISIKKEDKMLEWLDFACVELQNNGIELYNASPAGRLNSIPRIKL